MPYLIATDEAGYGPKLGPLVIVATAWKIEDQSTPEQAFANLRVPFLDGRCGWLHVDDSKRTFKRHKNVDPGRIPILDQVCCGASRWASLPDPLDRFPDWLKSVAADDFPSVSATPWLRDLSIDRSDKSTLADKEADEKLIHHWSSPGVSLQSIQARIITAARFNKLIDRGYNKADLLTEATCRLAFDLVSKAAVAQSRVIIRSDRHGGRAFYGAALQHVCDGSLLRVVQEGKPVSRYELLHENSQGVEQTLDWSFTIGGDSFAPVAMSSMLAKWVREHAMNQLNRYFSERMPSGQTLSPTAGYPSDADRFLNELVKAGLRHAILDSDLIRKR